MSRGAGGIIGLQSGRVGGIVLKQRNGKQIISEFFIPHNPQTARQMEVRSINTELSRAYRDDLNQGQRTAWSQRAEGMPGLSGETLFIRQNFPLLDFGLSAQITPPPMVMPPELADLTIDPQTDSVKIYVPHLTPAQITAQAPFIDIEVAGGFTSIVYTPPVPPDEFFNPIITSEALSQGRVHQKSDFKHCLYVDDTPPEVPPADDSEIEVFIPPEPAVRNVVVKLTRINIYGNKSGERIFNKIIFGIAP